MGRTSNKNRKVRAAASAATPAAPSTSTQQSVPELLAAAHSHLTQQAYETALPFLQQILAVEPSNTEALELAGLCLLEEGNVDAAQQVFTALTQPPHPPLAPPHLYLAQLSSVPQESLQHYENAIKVLQARLDALRSTKGKGKQEDGGAVVIEGEEDVHKLISRALVGMTEIYLTDLCFDPSAEQNCEIYLSTALTHTPNDPEPLLTLASVRLSQQQPGDASALIARILSLPPSSWEDKDPSTYYSLIRILLELGEVKKSLEVYKQIEFGGEDEVEGVYLEGWAWWTAGEVSGSDDVDQELKTKAEMKNEVTGAVMGRVECWEEAREVLTKCEALHVATEHPDPEILQHVQELISQLDAAGIRAAIGPNEEEDEEAGDEEIAKEEWEDWDEQNGGGDMEE